MKRLKKYLLDLDNKDTTYNPIYIGAYGYTSEGTIIYNNPSMSNVIFDPTYWYDDISFSIERSHKTTPDKPCVRIKIPLYRLNINYEINSILLADYCLRDFGKYINDLNVKLYNRSRTDKENGKFFVHNPTPEILERNSCYITKEKDTDNFLNILVLIQLPIKNHKKAMRMFCNNLTESVNSFIMYFKNENLKKASDLYEKQLYIREWLKNSNYCAFVANGSILPRSKGSSFPNFDSTHFISPIEDEIEILGIKGMGIKRGVTVITGGGYSGKSTLLNAINSGVYNHILNDGRELVITDESAIQISAEDGRSIKNVNISPFIKWIPKSNTNNFSTTHASGSTSQAANIMEAINFGSKLLLIDEDKSATNFMIQDDIMKFLVQKEPIIPFTERVNQIFKEMNISTILVIGGSSEYLSIADNIIMMNEFMAFNVTNYAKTLCDKKININNQLIS